MGVIKCKKEARGLNENYDRRMQAMMEGLITEGKRPRLLLHSCCALQHRRINAPLKSFDITSILL